MQKNIMSNYISLSEIYSKIKSKDDIINYTFGINVRISFYLHGLDLYYPNLHCLENIFF